MKKLALIGSILILIVSCKTQNAVTKSSAVFHAYQVSYDAKGRKVLRGLISRADIENDTAFSWFKKNYNLGRPDASAVAAFRQHAADFQMLIFGGTWCPDTQNLLPQFYRVADAAGFADSSITLIGVDDAKTTFDNLHKTFHLIDVPTFIVMKNGKEVGRVVEYGESGDAMNELGKIVSSL
ncbi:MAG TPA: thioredoxin family protein [Parafilimonas sp.]|nr:thioredoxin family protein [Parafilimonas sp.]